MASDYFQARFSMPATICVQAPGRVNFIGEHLDYNDGFVLPLAIDKYVSIAGTLSTSFVGAEFYSEAFQESLTINPNQELQRVPSGWQNYLIGVVAGWQQLGFELPPLKAVIASTVPLGSGLSSSAALEVAVLTFLESATGHRLKPWDKARLCQTAEHEFAGTPCGIMDQFSSVFGQSGSLMLLDCRSYQVQYIPFDDPDLSLLVTNSNVRHELVDGAYAQRRQQCESACVALAAPSLRDVNLKTLNQNKQLLSNCEYRRARHVVTEIQRTLDCAQAIKGREWDTVGQLMYQSHDSLRSDYEVSCPELDCLVDICRTAGLENGIYGSRMTGGGFGGSTVTLIKTSCIDAVVKLIETEYLARTGKAAHPFRCRPSAGANTLDCLTGSHSQEW